MPPTSSARAATRTRSSPNTSRRSSTATSASRTKRDAAHVATLDEIRDQGGNLNLAGYIAQPDDVDIPTVAEATLALKAALDEAWAAEDRLNQLLAERGIA